MPQTCALCNPNTFIGELKRAWESPPFNAPNAEWTNWFGAMLQRMAKNNSYHCESRMCTKKPGEWLNIDHVFVNEYTWGSFPDVAVEHENGDFVSASANSSVYHDEGSAITWAFWKAMSVQSHLPVIAAYPWKNQKDQLFKQFSAMAQSWAKFYERDFRCLFLLGWWNQADDTACDPISLYEIYLLQASPKLNAKWDKQEWNLRSA
jgi:hypothetical protein